MIVNSPIPSLGESIEYSNQILISKIYDFSNRDYWLVEVASLYKEHLLQVIPEHIQRDIQSGKLILAISNTFEGFTSIVDPIYLVAIQLNLPEDNIVLFTGNRNILSTIKKVSSLHNKKEIKCVWVRDAEFTIRVQSNLLRIPNRKYPKTYNKKFINFNRRWRPHRPIFVGLLYIKNLIDSGYISLTEVEGFSWNNLWENIVELTTGSDIRLLLEKYKKEITSLSNLYIDKTSLEKPCARIEPNTDMYYNDTYFSIVSETFFYYSNELEDGMVLTEKTFKPMLYQHPFILIGLPNSLKLLKELGYKTFSPFINEDYDNELDNNKRMLMIISEVERLCNLDDVELAKFIEGCISICNYNRTHLQYIVRNKDLCKELN
jgi:hypothetical protein